VRTAALVLGVAVVVVTAPLRAAESFPGAVQEYVQKTGGDPKCPVPCTLCHTKEAGGSDFLKETGFLLNLDTRETPLDPADPASVGFALQALAMRPCRDGAPGTLCDSDADGMPDVVELRQGRDPDGSRDFELCIRYGCGATIAPRGHARTEVGPLWLLAALGGVALLRRARRVATVVKS
jgi:hypothetical protein